MKACPGCGSRNQASNLFCPVCGHCFLPEKKEAGSAKRSVKPARTGGKGRSRTVTIVLVAVVILGLAAGLISFFVSREIDRSSEVLVETGTVWKCTVCGRDYKRRVFKVAVEKKNRDQYTVQTVDGECFYDKYGPLAGQYQDFFEYLNAHDFFTGYQVDIRAPAAKFMQAHPDLFPATGGEAALAAGAKDIDPQGLIADFDELAGQPVRITGTIVEKQPIQAKDKTQMTYMRLTSPADAQPGMNKADVMVFFPGVSNLEKDEKAVFYLLPMDLVKYHKGNVVKYTLLGVSMYQEALPQP